MIVLANDYGKDRIVIDPKNVYLYTKVNQMTLWRQFKVHHSGAYLQATKRKTPAIAGRGVADYFFVILLMYSWAFSSLPNVVTPFVTQ